MAKKHETKSGSVTSVVAREGNGNIQITFTIPFEVVKEAQEDTLKEFAENIQVPGFRKGAAPLSKVREKVSQAELIEHALSHLLPHALGEAVTENKLQIAIYPKFELISAKDNEPWQIRAITCELPEVNLGDYKKEVTGALRTDSIVVPGKEEKKEKTREEKESIVLKALLASVKIDIPQILIEEEANSRITSLLSRLEKLGLALENYLASVNKKVEDMRADYALAAKEAISVDLILNKIADVEKLTVDPKEVDAAFSMSQASQGQKEDAQELENRKRLIESILRRRKALDHLLALA
jgi:trigger factor